MKSAAAFAVVLVTAPDRKVARALAAAALEARLAACVNLVSAVESHYWWEGRLERSAEVLLLLKTRRRLLPDLERLLREKHPYDTPEFLAVPLMAGSERYLAWLGDALRPSRAGKGRPKRA